MNATNYAEEFAKNHHLRALDHYRHALEKHPYFADTLASRSAIKELVANELEWQRVKLQNEIDDGRATAFQVANVEIMEICDAIVKGDIAAAVGECYDAIAVLLRMVDALEGRQKLGKPEA